MVEAVNAFDNKFYPFTNTDDTIEFLDSVGASNLGYLYDIYHMYRMEGNIDPTLTKYVDKIEHIQIADSPGRNRPGTGEIDYNSVLKTIDECGYKSSVGLEFIAVGSTEESLEWLPLQHRRGIDPETFKIGA
jgi:hydroxypyruvate isomerase